jgi:16S rRNA (uracil1498-N3)-methyltransferase
VNYCPSFEEALAVCKEEALKIVLYEREGQSLKNVLKGSSPQRVYAMVGPEGGLAEEEIEMAKGKGFVSVKLGQRILRTETAAITLLGILQYELGDLS